MAINNVNVIDIVGITSENIVTLIIFDHLDWNNTEEHLLFLKLKINTYIKHINSGELYKTFPLDKEKHIAIKIYFKNEIKNELIILFLEKVSKKLNKINIILETIFMT